MQRYTAHTVLRIAGLTCSACALQETLRLYPPVGIGQLRAPYKADIRLAGHLSVPKGTILWVPHTAIQGTKHNWDEAQAFKPGVLRPSAARGDHVWHTCTAYQMELGCAAAPLHIRCT